MKDTWEVEVHSNTIYISRDHDHVSNKTIYDSEKLKFILHYNKYNKLNSYEFQLHDGHTVLHQTNMSFFISYGVCPTPKLSIVYEDKNLRLLSYSDSDYFIIKR